MARNALGRGLGALIRESDPAPSQPAPASTSSASAAAAATAVAPAPAPTGAPLQIDIDLIDPSPYQPRTRFSDTALEELSQSIRTSGIIQPLLARKVGLRYQLIAGERRWRAAQRAQLLRVPIILKEVREDQALELSLVENIQREDLNAIEQARAFVRLMDEFHMTQEEVATRTGKDRATVANAMRLLSLEETYLQWIEEGKLTAGHGRALLAIDDPHLRSSLAKDASQGKLTVRHIERLATRRVRGLTKTRQPESHDADHRAAIEELQRHLGSKVTLHMPSNGRPGQLILEFYDEEHLAGLYDRLRK
jgi:ParB family chromosome partitioning protein